MKFLPGLKSFFILSESEVCRLDSNLIFHLEGERHGVVNYFKDYRNTVPPLLKESKSVICL